jgi:hypothetical protein
MGQVCSQRLGLVDYIFLTDSLSIRKLAFDFFSLIIHVNVCKYEYKKWRDYSSICLEAMP